MTARKTTTMYYNGMVWQTVLMADGRRVARPARLVRPAGALPRVPPGQGM